MTSSLYPQGVFLIPAGIFFLQLLVRVPLSPVIVGIAAAVVSLGLARYDYLVTVLSQTKGVEGLFSILFSLAVVPATVLLSMVAGAWAQRIMKQHHEPLVILIPAALVFLVKAGTTPNGVWNVTTLAFYGLFIAAAVAIAYYVQANPFSLEAPTYRAKIGFSMIAIATGLTAFFMIAPLLVWLFDDKNVYAPTWFRATERAVPYVLIIMVTLAGYGFWLTHSAKIKEVLLRIFTKTSQ